MDPRPTGFTTLLTTIALVAFAANSILCRLALGPGEVDAGAFTAIRLISGAIALAAIVGLRDRRLPLLEGTWLSAFALFFYAFPFSLAYLRLPAGTGALVLFGAFQATMVGWDIILGRHPRTAETVRLLLSAAVIFSGVTPAVWPKGTFSHRPSS